jgi:Tol biopolymer transport system component
MPRPRLRLAVTTLVLLSLPRFVAEPSLQAPQPPSDPKPYFTEPAISPDRSEIAFASGGDIWTVPAAGGDARLLVSHASNESQPSFSPDGRTLAFVSDRTGGGDIYLLTLAIRRWQRPAGRLVARRPVDQLLVRFAGHRGQ